MSNTIAQNLQRLQTARTDIANAITTMGGTVISGDGFEEFVADIRTIPTESASTKTAKLQLTKKSYRFEAKFIAGSYSQNQNIAGEDVWTDGVNTYLSTQTNFGQRNSVLLNGSWQGKTWYGLTDFYGRYIWTDGDNIYYSNGSSQYILDKETSTWSTKTWNGLTPSIPESIWTDGNNIYYSSGTNHYVLDKETSTWNTKTWTGLTNFNGSEIWTNGYKIYYSSGTSQYYLNKSTSTWNAQTWSGVTYPQGSDIWTDGFNIYLFERTKGSSNPYTYTNILMDSGTWGRVASINNHLYKKNIWTNGTAIYHSTYDAQYPPQAYTLSGSYVSIPTTKCKPFKS